ncbi:hypothetical protein BC828DRAFT_439308 [Blastocladiella britannica]|nr:hypothetical protein BC828DRAFT_439308 [Blastocladiella britannica]
MNHLECNWDMTNYTVAFEGQNFALLKWRHAHGDDLKEEYTGEEMNPNHFIGSGPVHAELLEMYRWWKIQYGFDVEALKAIGVYISNDGYLPALRWWLSELDPLYLSDVRDLLATAFDTATIPAVLDVLRDYAHSRQYFIHPPGGGVDTEILDKAPEVTRAWWRAFSGGALNGPVPDDPLLEINSPDVALEQIRQRMADEDNYRW